MADRCVGISKSCACTRCTDVLRYITDSTKKRLSSRAHWTHVLIHDHKYGLRKEWVSVHGDLTPEDAIESRIRRLRDTPPTNGWSRDGSTLHIRQRDEDRWITYQGPNAHTEEWKILGPLNEKELAL